MCKTCFPVARSWAVLAGLVPLLLSAELRVELIELPPDPGEAEAVSGTGPAQLSTLSERFAGTGLGRRFVRLSSEKPFSSSGEAVIYTDPLLLSHTSPAHSHVVVDLEKRRAYLLAGHRMALESEISVDQFGQETPAGFFVMADRIKNGPIAEGLRTWVPYWMRLGSTEFGLHGGPLYGYASAGGCVRLPLPAAEILFEKTQEGTPVAIFESWSRETYTPPIPFPVPSSSPPEFASRLPEPPAPPSPDEAPAPSLLTSPPGLSDRRIPLLPPPLPEPLRPVSGTASGPAAPAPAHETAAKPPVPRQVSPPAPPERQQAAPAAELDSPEIARLRNLFRREQEAPSLPPLPAIPAGRTAATQVARGAGQTPPPSRNATPGFQPSEKHLKRLEAAAASRTAKRDVAATVGDNPARTPPTGPPQIARVRNLFTEDRDE